MRLVQFIPPDESGARLGLLVNQTVVEVGESEKGSLHGWLERGMPFLDDLRALDVRLKGGSDDTTLNGHARRTFDLSGVRLAAPIQRPATLRDFYAFEQHVKTAMNNRGREVPKEWYEIPVFYFSNPTVMLGHDEPVTAPKRSNALDYELEVACIIGRAGRDLAAGEAEAHILGYTLFNDWSARDLQRQEVAVGLGPAKGKDFASSLGPWVVTPDELEPYKTDRVGVYDIPLTVRVNGEVRGAGNWRDLHYGFGEMLARASADVTLLAGDVIGSGTVGTGCLLETTRAQGPWLQRGDVVELDGGVLGVLRTVVG
jgi:fumarylacetoacetate (FAA) hydrolase